MKLLNEISEFTLGIGDPEKLNSNYELRKNPRAILIDSKNNIAVQHIKRDGFHKLPGGGAEIGESIEEALIREVKEEVGCDCVIEDLLGVTIEYRNKYNLLQISYGFVAKVTSDIGEPKFDQAEIDEGLTNVWMTAEEALELIQNTAVLSKYEVPFILEREKSFLKEYLKMN